ncbi:hypothetical protein BvCmsB5655_03624 [Escherichia coli]|uniref:hypothetical protein n=1 Tax=Escherichia coli TaxID=562 RepID=UPI0010B60B37|nr:hypothetical protein [Escherichia coli]GCJ80782.1 hypothetical protein BvCmsB5655_03624 [Escherichia coli]HDS0644976.1 hypothetical protein [Escherichia coli]
MHQHKHHSYDFAINIMKFIRALEDGKLSHKYTKVGDNWFRNDDDEFRSHKIVYSNNYSANYLQDVVMCFEYVLQFRGSISPELREHMYIRYLPMLKDEKSIFNSVHHRVRERTFRDILEDEAAYFQQSLIDAPDVLQMQNLYNVLDANIDTDIFFSLSDYETFLEDLKEIGL